MKRSAILFMMMIALLPTGMVAAHTVAQRDANDAGKLDIRRVTLGHRPRRLEVRVKTDARWRERFLRAPRYVSVGLNPSGDNRNGYYVRVVYRGGQLRGIVRKVFRDFSYQRVGKASVSRPNGSTVRVQVRRSTIRAQRPRWLRWGAQTYARGNEDVAPEAGATYRHRI
jgi:hypothetical protein